MLRFSDSDFLNVTQEAEQICVTWLCCLISRTYEAHIQYSHMGFTCPGICDKLTLCRPYEANMGILSYVLYTSYICCCCWHILKWHYFTWQVLPFWKNHDSVKQLLTIWTELPEDLTELLVFWFPAIIWFLLSLLVFFSAPDNQTFLSIS